MNRLLLTLLLCTSFSFTDALSQTGGQGDPIVKFGQSILPRDMMAHLYFLASPELEGRETGERGQRVTAQYIAAQFRKLDLKAPVIEKGAYTYFQHFLVRQVTATTLSLTLNGKKNYRFPEDFITYNVASLPNDMRGELVFTGYGIEEKNYNNIGSMQVNEKIVVALLGEPRGEDGNYKISGNQTPSDWGEDISVKRKRMQEKGAKALVLIASNDDYSNIIAGNWTRRLLNRTTTTIVNPLEENPIPVILVNETVGNALLSGGKMDYAAVKRSLNDYAMSPTYDFKKIKFQLSSDVIVKEKISENVLGFLEGTDKKDELLVITAHMDHLGVNDGEIYYGADDDGSGTSAVLELAEAFSIAAANGSRPRRSILFMPVSGEEKGLLGSSYYTDHPVFPLRNTVANLNIDMIGRVDEEHEKKNDSMYVYIIGSDKLSSELHTINENANSTYTKINLDYTYNDPSDPNRFYYRSDHYNFAKNKIPVIFYFTGVHVDYHKPSDTPDKIQFVKMNSIVKLVFATAWEIANREEKLKVDKESDFKEDR